MGTKKLGFKIKGYQTGGKVEGPTHENGGVAAMQNGQQVAEVEGGERIFSTQDTAQIENMAVKIEKLKEQNTEEADRMALTLGYEIVSMLKGQESSQKQQEPADAEQEAFQLGAGAGDIDDTQVDEYIE